MKLIPAATLFFATVLPFSQANGQTQEERLVRTTYAKLIYAAQLNSVHNLIDKGRRPGLAEIEAHLSATDLKFEISNFSSGTVTDIAQRKFAELVTKPDGQAVLDIGPTAYKYTEDSKANHEIVETSEYSAQASWSPGQNLVGEDWNIPAGDSLPILQAQNMSTYSRYARYSVTVTFQGRSRGYNAMFLFGTGEEPVLVLDNVTNNSALNFFVKNSVYPAVLLRKSSKEPGVAAWLRSHQVRDAGCSGGKQEVCCDTSALKCGVSADDLTSALSGFSSQVAKPRDAPSVVSDHANSVFCN
jgi:hypothetical protein